MKIMRVLLTFVIAFSVIVGFRWYRYVSNTDNPYDEVGIEINSRMPVPVRKWGCDKLRAAFGNVLPPYGCHGGADGREWL